MIYSTREMILDSYHYNWHDILVINVGTEDIPNLSAGSQTLVSVGAYEEFVDVYLDGEKLEKGRDYTSESGSTRITIQNQTLVRSYLIRWLPEIHYGRLQKSFMVPVLIGRRFMQIMQIVSVVAGTS